MIEVGRCYRKRQKHEGQKTRNSVRVVSVEHGLVEVFYLSGRGFGKHIPEKEFIEQYEVEE